MFSNLIITTELPLIIFTLLFQLALGICLLATVYILRKDNTTDTRPLFGHAFILSVIALLSAITHLGTPTHGFWILTRLFEVPLSQEVVVISIFTLALLLQYLKPSKALAVLSLVIGLLGLLIMSFLYGNMEQTNPAWTFGYTLLNFVITSLVLGSVYVYVSSFFIQSSFNKNVSVDSKTQSSLQKSAIFFCIIGIILNVFYLPVYINYINELSIGGAALTSLVVSYQGQILSITLLFIISMVLCGISFYNVKHNENSATMAKSIAVIALLSILISFFIERNLFYALSSTRLF